MRSMMYVALFLALLMIGDRGYGAESFGYGFFDEMDTPGLMKLWGSDNPGYRNMSALEVARRIWMSDDPVALLKQRLPDIHEALKSDNPNARRAVGDMVNGLWMAGGKYTRLSVRLTDRDKITTYARLREELGVLLPVVCTNVKNDPHVWARAGAVDLAAKIIPPYKQPDDGLYARYADIVRPILLIRAQDDDRFMQQAAGRALNAIGIDGLPPEDVVKAMFTLLDTEVAESCREALDVLSRLSDRDLTQAVPFLLRTVGSDVVDGNHDKPGIKACELLFRLRVPEAAPAILDYCGRERHGHNFRSQALFHLIPQFTDAELLRGLPQLRRLTVMEEVRGRRAVVQAQRTVDELGKKESLTPLEMVSLQNARGLVEAPPHQWLLGLFERIGEPPPKLGVEITGANPAQTAETTYPPWIPVDRPDDRVPLPEQDGLAGDRALDTLPGREGQSLPIDGSAFSQSPPETNCSLLTVQIDRPDVILRRPLGPTGILGTFSDRRIYVTGTQPGSPAYRKVVEGDWIVGVNNRYFTSDPRVGMGWAIEESEARADGAMLLDVVRGGETVDITIALQPLGRHADTWPYNCRKSEKIFADLCAFIVRHDADWVIPGALVLLASGEDRYMPEVRRKVYELAAEGPGTSNWFLGYQLILLSEYYQRTGDVNILPAITRFAAQITNGQTYHGGYLHNVSRYNAWNRASKTGYGEMNMAGVPCLVGLVLANECGVELNQEAFRKSVKYFEIFSGRGCVPYGAHAPYIESPATGGKTAIAGVAFDLLGRAKTARPFVQMATSAYEYMWTGYHGGSYWNATWRPLCAARDSADAFKALANSQTWRFNLARHWHGGMTAPVRVESDFEHNHNPTQSLAFGLIYALPRKALRITGAPRSVFTRITTPGLTELKQVYDAKNLDALRRATRQLQQSTQAATSEKAVAGNLLEAAVRNRQTIAAELSRLDAALEAGDFFAAKWMTAALGNAGINIPAVDQKRALIQAHQKEINAGNQYLSAMHRLVTGTQTFRAQDCLVLAQLASETGYYATRAQAAMETYAVPPDGRWPDTHLADVKTVAPETIGTLFYLVSPSLDELRQLQMKTWLTKAGEPHPVDDLGAHPDLKQWYALDYDDSAWDDALGPYILHEKPGYEHEGHVLQRIRFGAKHTREIEDLFLKATLGPREFHGTVYLNGQALLELGQSPCAGGRSRAHRKLGQQTAYLKLPPVAKTLLREGDNLLAVRASVPPISNWSHAWLRIVDIGLGATKHGGGTWSYDPMPEARK